ncbi:JAB domain-containing protein [Candidatus Parcubacteria bacterium]|nr:MAG: JAB domain-containing protein [Candidatus Parcubacteria bacterium]
MQQVYTIKNNDLINAVFCDNVRNYVIRIRDLPSDEKPREKLLKNGVSSLAVQELLAVMLGVGTKKEDVLSMAGRILKEYGEKSVMRQHDPKVMAKDLDIPLVKAMQIAACSELGRRFFDRKGNRLAVIRTPRDVFEYVGDMRGLAKEHLRGIYLNAHHVVIHDEVISIGTVDSNIIHPREVFKPAVEYSAAGVILVHNHPSGVAEASKMDIEITSQLVKAGNLLGINLLDHVIVTKDNFASVPGKYN